MDGLIHSQGRQIPQEVPDRGKNVSMIMSLLPSISQAFSEREKIYMYCGKKVPSNLHTKVTIY